MKKTQSQFWPQFWPQFWLVALCLVVSCVSSCSWQRKPADAAMAIETPPTQVLAAEAPRIAIQRPELQIHQLQYQETLDPAAVVKAYVATIQQLIQYSESLERIIQTLQGETVDTITDKKTENTEGKNQH